VTVSPDSSGAAGGLAGAALDTYPSDHWRNEPEPDEHASLRALLLMAGQEPDAFAPGGLTRDAVIAFLRASGHPLGTFSNEALTGVMRVVSHNSRLVREHRHRRFDGPLLFFAAGLDHLGQDFSSEEWRPYISGAIHRHEVPSLHAHMTGPDAVRRIAPVLERWWAEGETRPA
jgi:enterobactin synthetase component F